MGLAWPSGRTTRPQPDPRSASSGLRRGRALAQLGEARRRKPQAPSPIQSTQRSSPEIRPRASTGNRCIDQCAKCPSVFTVIWLTLTRARKAYMHHQETKELAMDTTRSEEHGGGHQDLIIRATIALALFYGFLVTVSLLPV